MRNPRSIWFSPFVLIFLLIQISIDSEAAGPARWREIAPGIWKAIVGTPEAVDLLKAAGIKPRLEALKDLGTAPLPYDLNKIETDRFDGKTVLRFPLVCFAKIPYNSVGTASRRLSGRREGEYPVFGIG